MFGYKTRILIAVAFLLFTAGAAFSAQTWHLDKDQGWQDVSQQTQGQYLLAVAEIKKQINTGQAAAAAKSLNELKKNYPQIAGADLNSFLKAETLFCEGKFVKASRAYDAFLLAFPKSPLYEAALDRQFAIATAFLSGRKKPVLKFFKLKGHAEGIRVMERIVERAGDAQIAVKAATAIAQNHEKRAKYDEAYVQWSFISSKWPTGQTGRDSLLAMGRCKHAAYKGPKYDNSNIISAKSYYENFVLRYPNDAAALGLDKKIAQINEQLAYKKFSLGQYYQKTGNKQAANLYYQMVITDWPGTTAGKMAKEIMD